MRSIFALQDEHKKIRLEVLLDGKEKVVIKIEGEIVSFLSLKQVRELSRKILKLKLNEKIKKPNEV